jgi:hypothetical protein
MENWNLGMAVADGYLVTCNQFNNMLDCIGLGPSATTVSTQDSAMVGTPTLIKGTVTDQSPGTTCFGAPAKGTPAISDASMEKWMEYLYEQQAEPLNATGVPVTLMYVDANNNIGTIGTTTSDITGHYTYTFTPTIPGIYTIIATFGGSNSYSSSSAQTSILAASATTTAAPTATPISVADMYFVPAIAGIFVAIIVVAIVLALLMLRKKP